MRSSRLKDLVSELDGVDLVIRGHSEAGLAVSEDCADRSIKSFEDLGIPVLYAGDRGRVIGKVVLEPNDGGFTIADTTLIHLRKESPRDEEFGGYVEEFSELEATKLREIRMENFLSRDDSGKVMDRYLGAKVCSRCHSDISDRFQKSPHRTAFERIRNVDDRKSCLKCHTTGYGDFSGYGSEEAVSKKVELEGVRCEACHGPGTAHSRDGKYVQAAMRRCETCHTKERSPRFDYDEYMKKVKCYMQPDSVAVSDDCD
jgi:hypothetical protein